MSTRSFTGNHVAIALGVAAVGCRTHEHSVGATTEPLKVAAAADLAFAFNELGTRYEAATGRKVVFSFGSTGLLQSGDSPRSLARPRAGTVMRKYGFLLPTKSTPEPKSAESRP